MGNGGGYPTILYQDELEVVMVAIATSEKLAPLGKVEFRVSALSHGTPEHSEKHDQQAITAMKQEAWERPLTSLLGREGVCEKSKRVTDRPKRPLCGIAHKSFGSVTRPYE
jgi:hypothetical protein